ncbi:hypothetical protein GCM10011351_31770 [Paraliobacillus quinghaiensis]|uniref:DUF5067 domain-containing protein n=1 Tax=Paraliobacillus quinghaiensis TaxID=470815 RepID=A0A917WZ97_9BACI|nr:hypothetical protein [Paraliobacillus quinghaiensis]GGM43427.1 hypothetical protein GCM10011351_31770 [Paraliobacillus quinghaiensis]
MSKKVGLLFAILLAMVSIIACTSEGQIGNQDNTKHEEIQKDNGQSNESPGANKDNENNDDNQEIFKLENGLIFSVHKEKQDSSWAYIITGYYEENGYEMKNLNIKIGSDSLYVAEPSLYLEDDLKKQPFVIESQEPLASIDYSVTYVSNYGEEEFHKSFNLK